MSRRPMMNFDPIPERDESDPETPTRRGSTTPLVKEGMELMDISLQQIQEADTLGLIDLASLAGIINDERLQDLEDMRERLTLIKRKQMGDNRRVEIDNSFASMHTDNKTKMEALLQLISSVDEIFQKISTDSLSAVLSEEGHISQSLPQELEARMKFLRERNSTVIIAGETNGGKSTFLNLLLGESILPTDVLHCTYSVCRITYAETYSVHTVNYRNEIRDYPCQSSEQAKEILKHVVAREGVHERLQGSVIKEVMLKMPSPILKSGVTLVDTPGIGEDDQMDDVTMSFVQSTQASAFIYVIKSDTAGGVQEDRLLSFLRAIKQRYEGDIMKEYFDPLAAMFVCHRWDNIDESECEKVKQNALKKLEDVWPGFSPAQTFFFSTKSTMKHLPLDPDFITDSFYGLLKGLKSLFDRASYNAIKHQYIWLKHILQPASRHLRAMITHCIRGNEELEVYFHSLAEKQETLMMKSKENSTKLQEELDNAVDELKEVVKETLEIEDDSIQLISDYDDLLVVCSQEHFLSKQSNRQELDVMILRSLIKYVNRLINDSGAVQKIEQNIVQSIEEHLGLFKCQIREIKNEILHGETGGESRSFDNGDSLNQSYSSTASMSSEGSDLDEFRIQVTLEPSELAQTVSHMMQKRKQKKVQYNHQFSKVHEASQSLLERFRNFISHHDREDPELYLKNRVIKVCRKVREDDSILTNIVQSFVEWIETCVNRATESIPRFIKVNTTLMDTIRVDRVNLQEDKEKLKMVMEELEPSRDHLKGFGSLYMEDFNAEMVDFALPDRGVSSVVIPKDLSVSARPLDDSGFQGSGSKHRKVKSLWGRLQLANITVDGIKEKVILKTYTYDLEDKHLFSEIACLRCLEDDNIAQFFGMSRIRTAQSGGATFGKAIPESPIDRYAQKVSAFIFKGDLVSARIYASNKMICKKEFIPTFVHSLLAGLKYIHRERLVHMELNLDTVMVEKETGNVRLCQMCKPREARFPLDLTLVRTNSCVCLSPSVLLGDEYKPTDDIYAFGLLLWELLFPRTPPYKEQKDWLLKEFIEKCNPERMIGSVLGEISTSEEVYSVIRGTVFVKRNEVCMGIDSIQRYLQNLQDDPAVIHQNRVKYPARRKSDSSTAVAKQTSLNDRNSLLLKNTAPERPPRRTDALRNELPTSSASLEERASVVMRQQAPANGSFGRRNSEPAVLIGVLKIAEKKGLKSEVSNKVVGKLVKKFSPRRYSCFTDSSTNSELNSYLASNADKPPMTVRGMFNSRRLSMPDASLIVPKSKYPSQVTERPDVPEQMEFFKLRYSTPFSSMKSNQPASNSFSLPGRLIPSDSVPCLVPSVEEQKNSFFSKDEKLADSWQSPLMGRKSYSEGAESKSYSGTRSGLQDLPQSVYKAFGSASYSGERQNSRRSSSSSSCATPVRVVPAVDTLWEDDTRPLSEDFAANKNTNNLPNASVSSKLGGSGLFKSQNGFFSSSVSNRGKLSVSFKEQIDTIEPVNNGASNRSSSGDFLVAYSQSSDDDDLWDNSVTPSSVTNSSGRSPDSGTRSAWEELSGSAASFTSSSANFSDYSFDSGKKENDLWNSHAMSNGHAESSNNDMTWSSYDSVDGMEQNNSDEYNTASSLSFSPGPSSGPSTGPSPSNDSTTPCPPPIFKMTFNFK